MYEVQPLVCNLGEQGLRDLVAASNGVALAERCCYLNSALTEDLWRLEPAQAQVHFVQLLGADPNRDEVVAELVQRHHSIVAEPMGVATLGAYALAYGVGNATLQSFLKALMALTFETLREPGTELIRLAPDSMSSAIASSVSLGSERYYNVRWRLRSFIEWSRSPQARAHHSYIDLDADVRDVFGMTHGELVAAVTVIHTLIDFDVMRTRARARLTAADFGFNDRFGYVRLLMERAAIDMDRLATTVRNTPTHRLRDILGPLLLVTPLIKIDDDSYLPLSPRLFDNIAGLGWVYALADARAARSPNESARLWRFFGAFFEDYANAILLRVAAANNWRFWNEQVIGGYRTADGILRWGESYAFFEIVSSRLSVGVHQDPADEAALERDFERVIFEKVEQLAENVRRFMRGDYRGFGLNPAGGGEVFPVLIQYRDFLRNEEFDEQVQRRFRQRLNDDFPQVRDVEILDAEILESLEEHINVNLTLGTLIDEKRRNEATRTATFKNFVSFCHPELALRLPPQVQARNAEWQNDLVAIVRGWSIHAPE